MSNPSREATQSSEARLSAVPTSQEPAPSSEAGDPRGSGDSGDDRRVSRRTFQILLAALAILAIGFLVQSQRIGGFQGEIRALEGHIGVLSSDLASAESRVADFEREIGDRD